MTEVSFIFHDTQSMSWEDDPGIPGFKEKVLFRDENQDSAVRLMYVPPGFGDEVHGGQSQRHYHRTVIERAYVLYGDFPHWEFSSVDDFDGEMVVFRPGLVMDRPTGSLHGLKPEPSSVAGAVIMFWNTGPGASILDPTYAEESIDVPFDANATVELNRFNDCRIFMDDEVAWRQHPSVPNWKYKPLADETTGTGAVSMVHIPTDWTSNGSNMSGLGTGDATWIYLLSGDLHVTLQAGDASGVEQDLKLRQGSFLRWQAPAVPSFGSGPATETGCIALCVGDPIVGPAQ